LFASPHLKSLVLQQVRKSWENSPVLPSFHGRKWEKVGGSLISLPNSDVYLRLTLGSSNSAGKFMLFIALMLIAVFLTLVGYGLCLAFVYGSAGAMMVSSDVVDSYGFLYVWTFMGLILARIHEHLEAQGETQKLRHVTVIEEAKRIWMKKRDKRKP
jgi:hypothetical protein